MAGISNTLLIVSMIAGAAWGQFRAFPGGRKASEDFDCPEDFGYYPHPTDCSKYYVCVFGGALEESCTAGLVYSNELLTCDWPRNVQSCGEPVNTPRPRVSTVRVTDPRTAGTPRLASPTTSTTATASRSRAALSRRPSAPRRTPVLNSLAETPQNRFSPTTRRGPGRGSSSRSRSRGTTRASISDFGISSSSFRPVETSSSASIAERVRLLDNIDTRPIDLEQGFEGNNNKIVTRRQQKLLSPDSSSGRGRFQQPAQQSLQGRDSRAKATDAPVRISTLSSFSFGDTGTRFPPRSSHTEETFPSSEPQTAAQNRFPPRDDSPSSTFVTSTRSSPFSSAPSTRSSLFPSTSSSVSSKTVSTSSSSSSGPKSQTYTEPAYVAYVNDTIYDVYYIYDDDDLVYDDEYVDEDAVSTDSGARPEPTTRAPSPPRSRPSSASALSGPGVQDNRQRPINRLRTGFRTSTRPKTTATTTNQTTTKTTTTTRRPTTTKRRPTTTTRRPTTTTRRPTTTTRRTTTTTTRTTTTATNPRTRVPPPVASIRSIIRPSIAESTTRAKSSSAELTSKRGSSTLGSTFGFSRTTSPRGTSSLSGQRSSSTFVPSPKTSSGTSTERGRQTFVRPSSATSSQRTPSTGLKSIDSGGGRRVSSLFPKQTENQNNVINVNTQKPRKINIWQYPPRRPVPLYPQPEPDQPAERCDARCRLPDCSCGGTATPGGFEPKDTPQMVLLTFDDSINDINKELYAEMFEVGRKNPNGCPIAATFYLSHEWTDYAQVQNLYANGHEMASHSISHSFGEQFSTSKWEAEIAGQREIIASYGGVKLEDIRGMRAPFLSIGGNRMFKMLYNNNFTYDSSMPVYENAPPSWPYTLDYSIHHDCMIPPCPNKAYPGVWEVPMVMWQDLSGGRCSMVDACTSPDTAEGVYKMMIKNFERHYTSNRAIFPLYFHAAWMTTEHHKEGFMAFLDTISKMNDVWLVTNWQALQWMRDPQSLNAVNSFPPFGCDYSDRPRCTKPKKCNLWHKSGVRYMTTCQSCPEKYPWTGNTGAAKP